MAKIMQMEAGSLKMTLVRVAGLKAKVAEASLKALNEAGLVLHSEIVKNVSYADHSLSALARMDHPYATRHGSIRIHGDKPYIVHRQGKRKGSGNLHRNIQKKLMRSKRQYHIWVPNSPKYFRYVIQGTKVMLGRDVLWLTMNERPVRKKMMQSVVKVMGKDMRMKAVVRFD